MLKGFREFIMKGNVLELATAVIIAGAFGDIVMPPIGQLLGGVDFSELSIPLSDEVVLADGTVEPGAAIRYGNFIQTIINFLIIAWVIFLVLRSYNRMTAKPVVEEVVVAVGPTEVELLKEIRDQLARRPL